MEQVEGGDLVVNRGGDDTVAPDGITDADRSLNIVPGFQAAYNLANASLATLIEAQPIAPKAEKETAEPESGRSEADEDAAHKRTHSGNLAPVTHCPVFLRIQACQSALPFAPPATEGSGKSTGQEHLFFVIILRDPLHELVHETVSQAMPSAWLDIPFEENEWVEVRFSGSLISACLIRYDRTTWSKSFARALRRLDKSTFTPDRLADSGQQQQPSAPSRQRRQYRPR